MIVPFPSNQSIHEDSVYHDPEENEGPEPNNLIVEELKAGDLNNVALEEERKVLSDD